MTYRDKNEFTETINISSNIRNNKNTIIGKFDLKDILFILIAGVVGIGVLSVMLVALSIRNMFLILIVLALFEVPIVTLGFLKLHNIPVLDYIKMKNKSDNKSYRKQILKKIKSKADKYVVTICIVDERARIARPYGVAYGTHPYSMGELYEPQYNGLEQVMNDLYTIMPYKNIELKILFSKVYLTIEVEDLSKVLYDKLFDYLRINKDIKYISNVDISNFGIYINSLKFLDKKYNKKQKKNIYVLKTKLSKLKKFEETKDRYDYLTNRIIDIKDNEFTKVYKFLLYESPFDVNIFNELKGFCNITSHIKVEIPKDKNVIDFTDLSFVDTFIDMIGTKEEINSNTTKVKEILDKHHILYKEISEEKVKDSLLFLMENRY
ncbi:MAG: PrgI family protein [Lachnospiraceae bacterium]|nr:PrgI family protein [Lachnospiraceae bacterium]